RPRRGKEIAGEDPERRRLPRAVQAEEADDLASFDGEGERADRLPFPVVLVKIRDFDHVHPEVVAAQTAAKRPLTTTERRGHSPSNLGRSEAAALGRFAPARRARAWASERPKAPA